MRLSHKEVIFKLSNLQPYEEIEFTYYTHLKFFFHLLYKTKG